MSQRSYTLQNVSMLLYHLKKKKKSYLNSYALILYRMYLYSYTTLKKKKNLSVCFDTNCNGSKKILVTSTLVPKRISQIEIGTSYNY